MKSKPPRLSLRLWSSAACLCLLSVTPLRGNALQNAPSEFERRSITLTNSVEQASAHEVKFRLHSAEDPGPFDIAQESFDLVVPKTYAPNAHWGVLIWVDPSDAPKPSTEWLRVLAEHRLLFIGAKKSGNARNIFDRIRMAVHANVAIRSGYSVDPRRIYVSGFSGGARVASMLGVAWADMFPGAMAFMGVNFYTDIPMPSGKIYPPAFIPDDAVLEIARTRGRYVLVTGEHDFNKPETQAVFQAGFQAEKFNSVRYLEVPNQGHSVPSAQWLSSALGLLEGPPPR